MSLGIRKNDMVVVLSGRGRGKRGKVLRVDPASHRAKVEGVNVTKRFARRTKRNPQGGVIEQEAPIAVSNLALFCTHCNAGRRFRTATLQDGSKSRTCAECENLIGSASIK